MRLATTNPQQRYLHIHHICVDLYMSRAVCYLLRLAGCMFFFFCGLFAGWFAGRFGVSGPTLGNTCGLACGLFAGCFRAVLEKWCGLLAGCFGLVWKMVRAAAGCLRAVRRYVENLCWLGAGRLRAVFGLVRKIMRAGVAGRFRSKNGLF